MAIVHRSDVAGRLLQEVGIIADMNSVRRVTLVFDAIEGVSATIEQYLEGAALETIVRRLRVTEDGE